MIGEKLGSFQIEAVLGSGAMGVVYRATNETTRPAGGRQGHQRRARDQKGKASERFRREAEILQQFRHPNIVRFLAVGRSRRTSYFAMEFIPGQTLDDRPRGARAAALARGRRPGHPALRRPALRPRARRRPPRPEAVEPDGHRGRPGQADRLRHRQGPRRHRPDGHRAGPWARPPTWPPSRSAARPRSATRPTSTPWASCSTRCSTGEPPFEGATAVVLMHCHLNEPPPRPSAKVARDPRGARRPDREADGQGPRRPPLGRRGRRA